jgi:hypothetical protein
MTHLDFFVWGKIKLQLLWLRNGWKHCTHEVSTLKNRGETKNAMEIKYVIQISYLQLCALMKWDCSKL